MKNLNFFNPRTKTEDFYTLADFLSLYDKDVGYQNIKVIDPSIACFVNSGHGGYNTGILPWTAPVVGSDICDDRVEDPKVRLPLSIPNCVGYMQGRIREVWGNGLVLNGYDLIKGYSGVGSDKDSYAYKFALALNYLNAVYHLNEFNGDAEQTIEIMVKTSAAQENRLDYRVPFLLKSASLQKGKKPHAPTSGTIDLENKEYSVAILVTSGGGIRNKEEYRHLDIYANNGKVDLVDLPYEQGESEDFVIIDGNPLMNPKFIVQPFSIIVWGRGVISSDSYASETKKDMGHVAIVEQAIDGSNDRCVIGESGWSMKQLFLATTEKIIGRWGGSTLKDDLYIRTHRHANAGEYYLEGLIYPPLECQLDRVKDYTGLNEYGYEFQAGGNSAMKISNRIWVV